MNQHTTRTSRSALGTLAAAAILVGSAALADAAWRTRPVWHHRPIVHRPVVVLPLPVRPVVVPPKVIRPIVTPGVTVVVPAESAAAKELKAEIATLKAKYDSLSQTREILKKWLAGPGKDYAVEERVKVRTRLAAIDQECVLLAVRIAELEQKLAEL